MSIRDSNKFFMIATVIMPIILAGCAVSDTEKYSIKAAEQQQRIEAWKQTQEQAQHVSLLTDIISAPELTRLIQTGLEHNPSVQQAKLAVQIAQKSQTSVNSAFWPQANVSLQGNKTESSDESYNANLTVSWEADIWGKNWDSATKAQLNTKNQIFAEQYSKDLLAASIMRSWLQLIQQRQLIEIEANNVSILQQNEATILERYRKGLGSLEDLDTARSSTQSAHATLAQYEESYQQVLRSLHSTLGGKTLTAMPMTNFPEVLTPLAALPQQDLARRPDLRQAFINVQTAELDVDIAYKSMLPSLSLEASLADAGSSVSDALFTSGVWSVLGRLSAPLFQGGRLKAQAEINELVAEQKYWAYQQTLLTAVQEVENALGQEASLAKQQQHIEASLASARRSTQSYQEKYRQGLLSFIDLMTVQRQAFSLETQLTNLTYQRLNNRITLGLALGLGVSK
ncbi:RND transporter [Shewanella sp. OPT22]|nr:RND transporter [Shewanella sp. OPT22]